jgi:hypothetical protein
MAEIKFGYRLTSKVYDLNHEKQNVVKFGANENPTMEKKACKIFHLLKKILIDYFWLICTILS